MVARGEFEDRKATYFVERVRRILDLRPFLRSEYFEGQEGIALKKRNSWYLGTADLVF